MHIWVLLLGQILIVYAAIRYISGLIVGGAGENNLLISAIVLGVGVVLTVVSRFLKKKN